MKHLIKLAAASLAVALLALPLAGCSTGGANADTPKTSAGTISITSEYTELPGYVSFDEDDVNTDWQAGGAITEITLNGSSIKVSGNGAVVSGTTVTVTSPGVYHVTGTLTDGQLLVNSTASGKVWLVLDGAQISCSTSAAIWIQSADDTILTLADGSANTLRDGSTYNLAEGEDEPNAALFSKDDITINGSGSLTVNGNYANGIQSKDDLRIAGGTIVVTAVNNGIKGKDKVGILDGEINISCGGNALQASNDVEADLGRIHIAGGSINAIAGEDGIEAISYLLVTGGELVITSGGGSAAVTANTTAREGFRYDGGGFPDSYTGEDSSDTASGKALKADTDVTILGGTITVDSADDAVHANGSVTIGGGSLSISTGDDGVHADQTLAVTGGTLDIVKCYEGLEAAQITISGGDVSILADDDGINAADGTAATFGGMGGGGNSNCSLTITGGSLFVSAAGDGLDSNGSIVLSGGTVFVEGPLNDGNGALDYDGSFEMTGGTLIVSGSAGMAQSVGSISGVCGATVWLSAEAAGGTILTVTDASGNIVLTRTPSKAYAHLVLVSPDLKAGESYTVLVGGEAVGSFTADATSMQTVGTARGGMSGFGGGIDGGMGGGQRPDNGQMPNDGQMPNGGNMTPPERPGAMDTTTGAAA